MRIIDIMFLACFAGYATGGDVGSNDSEEWYNILTIDGGGIRGIISASCLNLIEKYAYTYVQTTEKYKQIGKKALP